MAACRAGEPLHHELCIVVIIDFGPCAGFRMNTPTSNRKFAGASPIRHGLTWVELIVAIAIVGVLAVLLLGPDSSTVARRKIERRARDWTPSAADRLRPDPSLIAPDIEIAGEWESRRHLNSCSLSIRQTASNAYAVDFATGGCMGGCAFQRSGCYRNGVLTLDGPVAEYMPAAYDTLYAIRVNGEELLLPAAYVERFGEAVVDGEVRSDLTLRNSVYRRASPAQEDLE